MEKWRRYFSTASSDIWTVIESAIVVAGSDSPHELRKRRDSLTELMYSSECVKAYAFEELTVRGPEKLKGVQSVPLEDVDEEEDGEPQHMVVQRQKDSNDEAEGYHIFDDDVEALTQEMEEEQRLVDEIVLIKGKLKNIYQSETIIMELLFTLEEMQISVEALKTTEIGKEVNALRKHSSKTVRSMTKKLVRSWKDLVDEWVKSTSHFASTANESTTSELCDDEEGLPSPPLDEGALLAARTATLEMSQFLDDFMDDDLSAGSNGLSEELLSDTQRNLEFRSSGGNSSSPSEEFETRGSKSGSRMATDNYRPAVQKREKEQHVKATSVSVQKGPIATSRAKTSNGNIGPGGTLKHEAAIRKPDLPSSSLSNKPKAESRPSLPLKPKPAPVAEQLLTNSEKLEKAKKRLHAGYQDAATAKKQRTVQALDLTDLPKGGPKSARLPQPHVRPIANGQNRNWAQGRR